MPSCEVKHTGMPEVLIARVVVVLVVVVVEGIWVVAVLEVVDVGGF